MYEHLRPQTNLLRSAIITPAYERVPCASPKVTTALDVDPVGEAGPVTLVGVVVAPVGVVGMAEVAVVV